MAPSSTHLRKAALGVQTTAGTTVAATRRMPCVFTLDDVIEWDMPDEQQGDFDTYTVQQLTRLVNVSGTMRAYVSHVPMLLNGVVGLVTPSTVDTTGRIWAHTSQIVADKSKFTLEWFDGDQGWEIDYLCLKSCKFSFDTKGTITVDFTGYGRAMATDTVTTLSRVNDVALVGWQSLFYIDAVGGTPGTTLVTKALTNFEFSIDNGAEPDWTADNSQKFQHVGYGKFEVAASLGMFPPSAGYQHANYTAGTSITAQVEVRGAIITAAYQGFKFDLCGPWKARKPGDRSKLNHQVMDWIPRYDTTNQFSWRIRTTNLEAGPY